MTLIPLIKLLMAVGFLLMPLVLIAIRKSTAMPEFIRAPEHFGVRIVFLLVATVVCLIFAAAILISVVPPPAIQN
jgi:Trk-type K+ transport system membrane component